MTVLEIKPDLDPTTGKILWEGRLSKKSSGTS